MKNHAPGKSHRTPIKHFVLNLALGQIVGVLSNRNPIVPHACRFTSLIFARATA